MTRQHRARVERVLQLDGSGRDHRGRCNCGWHILGTHERCTCAVNWHNATKNRIDEPA